MVRRHAIRLALVCLFAGAGLAFAGEEDLNDARDPLGRDSPRGAVAGFLRAADEGDFSTAARYMDLRNVPKLLNVYTPEQLARGLDIVLQRALWVDVEGLSDEPMGLPADGLPSYRDELGRVPIREGELTLLLQRVPGDVDGQMVWKFSNRTISRLEDLYQAYRYPAPVERLGRWLPDVKILGLELFKWATGLLVALASLPVVLGIFWIIAKSTAEPGSFRHRRIWWVLSRPATALIASLAMGLTIRELGLGVTARSISDAKTMTIVLSAWLMLAIINAIRDLYADHLRGNDRDATVGLLNPIMTAVKSVIVVMMALIWLDNIGFNITTLLAGLGIGGVAVALVLQKPLEDVFGAFTLFNQQPIRIGDFCQIGEVQGTLEEISLRTTRIRTLAGTVVSIPNAKLVQESINNISIRNRILYRPTIRLAHTTTPNQLEQILSDIREMLENDDRVINDRLRVRFVGFGEYFFNVEAFADVDTRDYATFLEIAEDLNLKVVHIVNEAGATFAVPERGLLQSLSTHG